MQRYLVVANQTLGGPGLIEYLRQCVKEEGPIAVHVLVPSNVDPQGWVHDDDSDHVLAQQRMDEAIARFREQGMEVTGEIGDNRPVDAVLDVLRRDSFDTIVVSTLPVGVSRWLRLDLVSRLQRAVTIPVVHLVAEKAPAHT